MGYATVWDTPPHIPPPRGLRPLAVPPPFPLRGAVSNLCSGYNYDSISIRLRVDIKRQSNGRLIEIEIEIEIESYSCNHHLNVATADRARLLPFAHFSVSKQ